MFHVEDGLYFDRVDDEGTVRIIKRKTAIPDDDIIMDITVDKDAWASIVSSVCFKGEDADTFHKAGVFHEIGRHEWPTKI